MTIEDNIAYGLMIKGVAKAERVKQVGEMLELVRLPGLLEPVNLPNSPADKDNASHLPVP